MDHSFTFLSHKFSQKHHFTPLTLQRLYSFRSYIPIQSLFSSLLYYQNPSSRNTFHLGAFSQLSYHQIHLIILISVSNIIPFSKSVQTNAKHHTKYWLIYFWIILKEKTELGSNTHKLNKSINHMSEIRRNYNKIISSYSTVPMTPPEWYHLLNAGHHTCIHSAVVPFTYPILHSTFSLLLSHNFEQSHGIFIYSLSFFLYLLSLQTHTP